MNKGIIIAVFVAGVLLLGGAGYVLMNQNNREDTAMTTESDVTMEDESSSTPQSLRSLMALGNNQMCTFSDVETGTEGISYIGNGNVRTDFQTVTDGTTYNSHMIMDSENMYVWMDETEGGFMMSLADAEEAQNNPALQGTNSPQSVDLDEQVDYRCESWPVDATKFTVPSDREFTNPSAMMEQMMQETTEESDTNVSEQCSACDSLTGDAAVQCRQVLSCN